LFEKRMCSQGPKLGLVCGRSARIWSMLFVLFPHCVARVRTEWGSRSVPRFKKKERESSPSIVHTTSTALNNPQNRRCFDGIVRGFNCSSRDSSGISWVQTGEACEPRLVSPAQTMRSSGSIVCPPTTNHELLITMGVSRRLPYQPGDK
jgi:hypothetical protein